MDVISETAFPNEFSWLRIGVLLLNFQQIFFSKAPMDNKFHRIRIGFEQLLMKG